MELWRIQARGSRGHAPRLRMPVRAEGLTECVVAKSPPLPLGDHTAKRGMVQ